MTTRISIFGTDSNELDLLFPGEIIKIGSVNVEIKPLTFKQIALVLKKSKILIDSLSTAGITKDNYAESQNILTIVTEVMTEAPSVLEEATNISVSDLERLPIDVIVNLVSKVIEVNLKSKDDLLKNFKSLVEKITPIQSNPAE